MRNFSITPWKTAYSYSHEYVRDIKDAQGELIAQVCDLEKESDESTANARLIAAAPDLLDALTNLYLVAQEQLDQSATHDGLANCDWLAAARAAIAKATATN